MLRRTLREHRRPRCGVLAPAFPAMGRTHARRPGVRAWHAARGHGDLAREHSYANARSRPRSRRLTGVAPVKLPLVDGARRDARSCAAVLGGCRGERSAAWSASSSATRRPTTISTRIASAARSIGNAGFFIGTAGLAHALARAVAARERAPLNSPRATTRGALIVMGSLAQRVARRPRASSRRRMVSGMSASSRQHCGRIARPRRAREAVARASPRRCRAATTCWSRSTEDAAPDPERGPSLVRGAGRVPAAPATWNVSALVVTGGETASPHCCAHWSSTAYDFSDEIEPGIALGIIATRRRLHVPIVTKPGAFGDDGSLMRTLERLRIDQTQTGIMT